MLARMRGFTITEIVIVIVVLIILALIAVPTYHNHVNKAKHEQAKAALLDLANRLEQYHTTHQTYATAKLGSENGDSVLKNPIVANGFYELKIVHQDKDSYIIEVMPIKDLKNNINKECGSLQLDQSGDKSISGKGNSMICWE